MRKIPCTLLGHENEWVERIDKVPKKLWDDWKKAPAEPTFGMIPLFIKSWNLKNIDGTDAPQPNDPIAWDGLEVGLLPWMIQIAITESILDDMTLLPNKLSPLPATPMAKAADLQN